MKEHRQPSDVTELVFAEQKQIVPLATQASDLREPKNLVGHLRTNQYTREFFIRLKRSDAARPDENRTGPE